MEASGLQSCVASAEEIAKSRSFACIGSHLSRTGDHDRAEAKAKDSAIRSTI